MASLIQRPGASTYYIQFMVSGTARRVSTGTESLQFAKEKLRQFESAHAHGDDSPLPTRTPISSVVEAYVYNAGRLHGEWINADQDAEAIHAAIAAMLSTSKEAIAEEWAIHDYEGFGGLSLGEYESIEKVAEVAAMLSEHGEIFGAVVSHFGGLSDLDEAKRCMEAGYHGAFKSLEDYVHDFVEDCYGDSIKGLPDFTAALGLHLAQHFKEAMTESVPAWHLTSAMHSKNVHKAVHRKLENRDNMVNMQHAAWRSQLLQDAVVSALKRTCGF